MEFNLADLWERVVDTVPEHEAIVCGDRRLTFQAADERATAGDGAGTRRFTEQAWRPVDAALARLAV